MPSAKKILKRKINKPFIEGHNPLPYSKSFERKVDEWLGSPMDKAYIAGEEAAPMGDDPVDNFRHPMAGRYTSEAIQNKTGNIPVVSNTLGYIGSNYLGAGHELKTMFNDNRSWPIKLREAGEDIFNNGVGSFVGSLPINSNNKTNILRNASNNNQLPDGYGDANMYFKKEFNNGGYIKKLKYNKKGTYPTYEFPPMAFGGWLDNLPNQYADGGNIDGVEPPPLVFDKNDPYGQMRYKAYNDSLNVYNGTHGDINKLKNAETFDEWWKYSDSNRDKWNKGYRSYGNLYKLNKKAPQPVATLDRLFPHNRDKDFAMGSANEFKKPTTPVQLIDERQPYSPVQTNPNSTVQLPISNISLQQMPTIGIGEPTFEGNNAYWKKQDNQLIYQNNDYSNNMNLPISNKPGDRFHQEPSWMVGDDRYYERDGEAYLVPQPKGGWKNKQILDPSSGKWKSKIVKKASGGWLDEYSDGGSLTGPGKLLNRSRKEIIKQRELEENLRKEGFNEDGIFTRVLPEYTVKSPEKKLYDEAYNKSIAQQQAFQNSWYPGSTDSDNLGYAPGVMDNIKQRATVKANDFVAKNLVNNNKIGDLKDYQKDYIATSNYSGKLRPNIGKQFTEGVQNLGRITQGKLPTSKSLGILSPLEYPVNLVRGTIKGEGVDALKGNISSPWLDANDVDPGAVNEVGVYNTMTDLALDPLNLSGTGALLGRTGVKGLKKTLNQIDLKPLQNFVDDVATPIRYRKDIKELKNQKIQSENFWKSEEGRKRLQSIGIDADKTVPYDLTFNPNQGSYYYGPGNKINIDFKQLRKLKKDGLELSPKTVLGHEEGHYIQREKYRMNDYLDDVKAYQVRLKDYEKNLNESLKKSGSIYSNPFDFLNLQIKPYPPVLTSKATQTDNALKFLEADPNVIKNLVNKETKSIGLPENSLDYWHYYSDVERFAHLREMRQNMVNKNVIKNIEDPITEDMIMNFTNQSKGDRISSFVKKSPNNLKFLAKELNKAPALIPIGVGAGVGAGVLQQKKNGGWLDNL